MSEHNGSTKDNVKVICSFNLTISAKKLLAERATEEHRSMSAHIEYLIERDARYAKIPVKGFVDDAGNVQYSDAPADHQED